MRLTPLFCGIALLTGCARASVAPWPVAASDGRFVATATRLDIAFAALADSAARADVVFFGEMHGNPSTHRAEAALLSAIGSRRKNVVVSLEMFERDVQPVLDAYLAGRMPESTFLARSRPWTRYRTDYRPILELAKKKKWRVVASNVPRVLAASVSRNSLNALDTLGAQRGLAARDLQCGYDAYYRRFAATMTDHSRPAGPSPSDSLAQLVTVRRYFQAQCLKDETMAESIVEARAGAKPGAIVVHFNGAFHSDYRMGVAERVLRRDPAIAALVISAVPVDSVAAAEVDAHTGRGDYVVFVPKLPRSP